ncbi:hypothetical protein V8F20_007824 [Naviculisporaceae sp. PSN 640]
MASSSLLAYYGVFIVCMRISACILSSHRFRALPFCTYLTSFEASYKRYCPQRAHESSRSPGADSVSTPPARSHPVGQTFYLILTSFGRTRRS